ncbi:MAG: hypothetical protein IT235_06800 [Bacteroidia bacterium]|nr:hypothetical protein [Bacteroidia bacterium]
MVQTGVDLNVIYRNEAVFGVLAHSNGFGAIYRRAKHVTADRKRVLEIEFVNMSHPKEVKSINPYFENSKGFYYGKLNSILIPRVGVGFQNVLFRKAERRSVEIRYSTYIGASIALAKPVYLEILQKTNTPSEFNLSTERYDPSNPQHSFDNIYGRAPYFTGFDQLKIYPGAYVKLGLSFEYGDTRSDVKVIETGLVFDMYPKVVPIMAYATNYQIFPTLYISFIYGKKWF